MRAFPFEITATEGKARTGVLKTARGDIRTPAFMPVGTAATFKGVDCGRLAETGAGMVLANTYHLHLRPGAGVVEQAGQGLQRQLHLARLEAAALQGRGQQAQGVVGLARDARRSRRPRRVGG